MDIRSAITNVGAKGRQLRIDLGLKQEDLAQNAGVSLSTLKAFESGKSISVANLVKILAQLDCLDAFEQIIPDVAPNPLDLIKLEGKTRQRVR
ncbi:MAG: helix-turn-helix domain-containing protein [Verrucomicrobiia bacterium]